MMIWKVNAGCHCPVDTVNAVLMMCFVADYGFEYSDEEVEEEDVDIENQYYNSKGTDRGGLQLFFVGLLDPS